GNLGAAGRAFRGVAKLMIQYMKRLILHMVENGVYDPRRIYVNKINADMVLGHSLEHFELQIILPFFGIDLNLGNVGDMSNAGNNPVTKRLIRIYAFLIRDQSAFVLSKSRSDANRDIGLHR